MKAGLACGVDGGGTHTRAILVDAEGRVLGTGQAGSSNINIVGFESAAANVRAAVVQAWAASGRSAGPVDAAFLGLSGIEASGRAADLAAYCVGWGLAPVGACLVGKDSEAALAGALSGRPGIVLIAGTGSFCLGRDAQGRLHRCGGWGWLVDDIGGGSHLGREALRAVLLAADGRAPATSLTSSLLAHAQAASAGAFTTWLYRQNPLAGALGELGRLVVEQARTGDGVAERILREGAAGLAELAAQVAPHIDPAEAPELVLIGGLARSGAPYQPLIEEALRTALPSLRLRAPEPSPVAGAALRAFEHLGLRISLVS